MWIENNGDIPARYEIKYPDNLAYEMWVDLGIDESDIPANVNNIEKSGFKEFKVHTDKGIVTIYRSKNEIRVREFKEL